MSTISWGILSTAKIGIQKVIPAIQAAPSCTVQAICSRSLQASKDAAGKLSIPDAYGSYEELLDAPDIDAVYIPLPNHLHVEWSVKALEAGKHVLVEKPIGLDGKEAKSLLESCRKYPGLKVMEAFMYRHHPQWLKAKELTDNGEIGELQTVNSFFSYYNADPDNVRNKADIGGGAIMDIGCYPVSLSRFLFGCEPKRVIGTIDRDPNFHTDRLSSAIMVFPNGTSTFTCSTQLSRYQRVVIYGTTGHIEIEIPFNAPPDKPCRIWITRDGSVEEISFDICDQYTIQAELFARSILDDSPVPTPLDDALCNMIVIDALFESGRTGSWATCSAG